VTAAEPAVAADGLRSLLNGSIVRRTLLSQRCLEDCRLTPGDAIERSMKSRINV
jgi:hypothetical protein